MEFEFFSGYPQHCDNNRHSVLGRRHRVAHLNCPGMAAADRCGVMNSGRMCHEEKAAKNQGRVMPTPIQQLIEDRCRILSISRRQVVHRAGYRNLAKGLRRLDELPAGELHTTRGLIERLPAALDVPPETVNAAISETDRQIRAEADQAYRAAFRPHAVILTEHTRPTHITFAAITGADARLRIDFEPRSNRLTYIKQALRAVRQRSPIRFYGHAVGVVVNFSPDEAVRFDLNGEPREVLPRAYEPGQLTVLISGRPVSRDALNAIFWG
jgi:hypothetical protein